MRTKKGGSRLKMRRMKKRRTQGTIGSVMSATRTKTNHSRPHLLYIVLNNALSHNAKVTNNAPLKAGHNPENVLQVTGVR